jgi:hypothetical protein
MMTTCTRTALTASFIVAALCAAAPAFAGPPLLCFPFDIGGERTLPMGTGGWHEVDPTYDVSHLVDDTLRLLTPRTPVIARMETIRRATIYAAKHPEVARTLMDSVHARARVSNADAGHAVFDFGYLVETYKQAKWIFSAPVEGLDAIDGYNLVLKARALQRDPSMEFAAAVITEGNSRTKATHAEHLTNVVKAAGSNPSLDANVKRHFHEAVSQLR